MSARTVTQLITAQPTSDGAGVRLFRTIGSQALDSVDPFLLLDEFKSEQKTDYIAGFPDHPHRGFETVTYMLEGQMRHRDSAGNESVLRHGDVQRLSVVDSRVHGEQLPMVVP